jgi:hypothetical protein
MSSLILGALAIAVGCGCGSLRGVSHRQDAGMDPQADDRVAGRTSWFRSSAAGWVVYVCVVVCFAGALVMVDRSDSDTANQGTLLLLLAFAAALGALRPRLAWLSALILGSTIAAARAIGLLVGQTPADPQAPRSLPAVATLLVLVVPAAVASYAGATARRAATGPSSEPEPPTSA